MSELQAWIMATCVALFIVALVSAAEVLPEVVPGSPFYSPVAVCALLHAPPEDFNRCYDAIPDRP